MLTLVGPGGAGTPGRGDRRERFGPTEPPGSPPAPAMSSRPDVSTSGWTTPQVTPERSFEEAAHISLSPIRSGT